ncbi:MAG: class I SAM-dependent methyltransferase [Sulfuritalea sp.]|nr:class I SAM-dependent methyltransferase [Sulfuritalea sp.]
MSFSWKLFSRTLRLPLHRRRALKRLAEFHSRSRTLEEIVWWALNFGGKGFMAVSSMQIPFEITQLAKVVYDLKPKISLEIGTAHGGTCFIWSQLTSEEVIACDINDMSHQKSLYEKFPPASSACKVRLYSGDSHEPGFNSGIQRALNGRQVDFLFIDGDHTVEGVTADYEEYREFVRPGGVIAFHDIVDRQSIASNQVGQFWQRLKKVADVEEFVENQFQTGYGIGILRVPSDGAPTTL